MKIEIRYEWICWHLILTILELMLLKCSRSNRPVWSNLVRATSAFSIQANTTMDSILDLIDYNLSLSICVRSAAWAEQALIVYFCKKIDSLNSPLLLVLPRMCYCLYFIWFFYCLFVSFFKLFGLLFMYNAKLAKQFAQETHTDWHFKGVNVFFSLLFF